MLRFYQQGGTTSNHLPTSLSLYRLYNTMYIYIAHIFKFQIHTIHTSIHTTILKTSLLSKNENTQIPIPRDTCGTLERLAASTAVTALPSTTCGVLET